LKAQFAKAYYNMALIYDRLGDIPMASANYKLAIDKNLKHQPFHVKAVTNYAVTLEKMGLRMQALEAL
jgi:tetratricopeptide (TPR) repeat protein